MKKKALVLALCGLLAAFSLAGCSSFDGDETAMTVGDDIVTADLANFASRYIQAEYETYYGAYFDDDMWSSEAAEGLSYEDYVKQNVQNTLKVMLLCEQNADVYGVEITDTEMAVIDEAVTEFSDANVLDAKQKVSGDQETVKRFMVLMIEEARTAEYIEAEVDTSGITDEDAAQKDMSYIRLSKNGTDEDGNVYELSTEEQEALKDELEDLVEQVRAGGDFDEVAESMDLNVLTTTFDADTTVPDAEVVAAADALEKEGDVTDVINTDSTFYVAQVTSLYDEDATKEKKEELIQDLQDEHFSDVMAEWEEDTEVTVNESVWNKIDFNDLHVTMYIDESEDYTDSIVTDDVAEENVVVVEGDEEDEE